MNETKMAVFGLVIGLVCIALMGHVILTYYNVEILALVSLVLGTLGAGMSLQRLLELFSNKSRKG